jgi:hypothetical protein
MTKPDILRSPQTERRRYAGSTATHYCRECGEAFESDKKNLRMTAHATCVLHVIQEHNPERPYLRCSKNCTEQAQPEEIVGKARLYGKGIRTEKPIRKYEEIFPPD